jgi:hypothetical protein
MSDLPDNVVQRRDGITRMVFLVGRHALKLPQVRYGWRLFLQGLLANMQESAWNRDGGFPELCPVTFSLPGGWLVVMMRAQPLSDEDWRQFLRDRMGEDAIKTYHPRDELRSWTGGDYLIPVEIKPCSFGKLDGRIVAVDYGN